MPCGRAISSCVAPRKVADSGNLEWTFCPLSSHRGKTVVELVVQKFKAPVWPIFGVGIVVLLAVEAHY
ncbi:hypothetical protein ACHAW6_015549 [Cyclotella cf. meneghiniana]